MHAVAGPIRTFQLPFSGASPNIFTAATHEVPTSIVNGTGITSFTTAGEVSVS